MPKDSRLISDGEIIELYQSGVKYKEIAHLAGISPRAIRNVIYKHDIPLRPRYRKHKVNEDFFKVWTNEMAWVLGMFVTDGFVADANQSIGFTQKDESILRLIAKHMDAEFTLSKISNTRRVPTLLINSKKIKDDLFAMGIFSRKSNTILFPYVPKEFMCHFVRGVIDGDGWVQNSGYIMNVTSGSLEFSNGLLSVFESWNLNSRIRIDKTKAGRKVYRVFVSGKVDIANLAKIIYVNCGDNFVYHKRLRMSQRLEANLIETGVGKSNMWKVTKHGLVHTTDTSRKHFRTSISKSVLESFDEIAKEKNTYVNYLIENGLENLLNQDTFVFNKDNKPKDRIQYNTTYDSEILDKVRGFAKNHKVNINDVIESSLQFIDLEKGKDVHHRYRIER
jgi:hypothetical protein